MKLEEITVWRVIFETAGKGKQGCTSLHYYLRFRTREKNPYGFSKTELGFPVWPCGQDCPSLPACEGREENM